MQRIYLLLRNNNQSGPFTIEELLEQEILPSDLIWIEGKSLAWSYASELNLLKLSRHGGENLHHAASPAAHSPVHSMPPARRKRPRLRKGEIQPSHPASEPQRKPPEPLIPAPMSSAFSVGDVERKAEELRQRALEAERTYHYHHPTPAPTPFTPDLTGNAESDIEFVYHKKGLNIPFPQVLVGGMVIAMLVAGWYGKPLFRQKMDTVDATATPLTSTKEYTAAAPILPAKAPAPVADTTAMGDSLRADSTQPLVALYKPQNHTPARAAVATTPDEAGPVATPETTTVQKPEVVSRKVEPEVVPNKEPEKPAAVVTAPKKDKEPTISQPVAAASEEPKEKKKGFLKGLFKKKKNRDAEGDEDPAPDSNDKQGQ